MTTLLSAAEIAGALADHGDWSLVDGMLQAERTFQDFAHALLYINAVGYLAEVADHHPDLLLHGYRHVRIRLRSHDVGGITARDIRLVVAIDALPEAPRGRRP